MDSDGPKEREGRLRQNIAGGLRLAWRASPSGFMTNASVAIGVSLVPPVVVWLGKRLVDLVVDPGAARSPVVVTVVALGLLAAGQRTVDTLRYHRQELFAERVRIDAERRFLEQAAAVDVGHFDNSNWYDRVARATRDLEWRPFQLTWSVIGLGSSGVTTIGMLGILASMHPVLVGLSLLSVVPVFFIQRRINKHIYSFWWIQTPESREKDYLRELLSQARWSKELRAFGLRSHFLHRHGTIVERQHAKLANLYSLADRYAVASGLFGGGALALSYWFVASRALGGSLTAGDLTAVIGAMAAVTMQIGLIGQSVVSIDQHAQFLEDYFAFLAIEPLIDVRETPVPLPPCIDTLDFDDVTFRYPGGTENALDRLSLRIRRGELLALVGDNGAGKTSLVKLLLRFYDPQGGTVRIGGVDLREIDPAELRSRIGVLFQDFGNYELSARENVALGRADREAGDDAVFEALQSARADAVVKRLPRGLDSKVGRLFEGGHDLSGGEWQRLALARLLFRDADIWILDEPTATLDAEAEAAIFAELRENLRGRIGIVISHRFSTVRIADRIAVVQDGRVTELGTHDELLTQGGRYAQLFELQAAGYR